MCRQAFHDDAIVYWEVTMASANGELSNENAAENRDLCQIFT